MKNMYKRLLAFLCCVFCFNTVVFGGEIIMSSSERPNKPNKEKGEVPMIYKEGNTLFVTAPHLECVVIISDMAGNIVYQEVITPSKGMQSLSWQGDEKSDRYKIEILYNEERYEGEFLQEH